MAGCDFNPRWFWTKSNYNDVIKIIQFFDNPIVHICSGVSSIGNIRMDKNYITSEEIIKRHGEAHLPCNIIGDMLNIPFKSGIAGSVICDPPYDYDFTDMKLINELVRIAKPKAKILFIAPWVPANKNITVINTELWNVGKRPYHKIRTLFYKSGAQLSDF